MQMKLTAEAVIEPILRDAIRRAAGLEDLRAGRHTLRDANDRRAGEVIVRKLWAVRVQPPAAAPAYLVAFVTDQELTVIFAVPQDLEGISVVTSRLRFDIQQSDPVVTVLSSLDLWSGDNSITLAGCSYNLFVSTAQMDAVLRFGNPRTPNRLALQMALLEVAGWFITGKESSAVATFVDRWQATIIETTFS